jgi:hypothetical protein
MGNNKKYPLKSDAPGLAIVCGSISCSADGYVTSGAGWTSITHVAGNSTLVITHEKFPELLSHSVHTICPDTNNQKRAYLLSCVPTTGVTTIQEQTVAGTAGDFINASGTTYGTRIDFVLYFRNADLKL